MTLASELGIASIVDPDGRMNTEMWEGGNFGGTLLVEAVSAVPTVVLSIGESKWRSASHTDV